MAHTTHERVIVDLYGNKLIITASHWRNESDGKISAVLAVRDRLTTIQISIVPSDLWGLARTLNAHAEILVKDMATADLQLSKLHEG